MSTGIIGRYPQARAQTVCLAAKVSMSFGGAEKHPNIQIPGQNSYGKVNKLIRETQLCPIKCNLWRCLSWGITDSGSTFGYLQILDCLPCRGTDWHWCGEQGVTGGSRCLVVKSKNFSPLDCSGDSQVYTWHILHFICAQFTVINYTSIKQTREWAFTSDSLGSSHWLATYYQCYL